MSLLAGTAKRDISPTRPMQLCGYPHVKRVSTGIHDPLLASALYLRNDSGAVLLCALDLLFLDMPMARRLRARVAQRLDMSEASVLISCTHTHSGPSTLVYLPFRDDPAMPPPDPAYLQMVETRVLETAVAAKQHARPAELAWTSADARGVGGNRHSPNGATDPEAGVLAVRGASRGPLFAVATIYGMHPTVMHEDSTLISADFPHYARLHLQESFGRNLNVVYHSGPAGNQSPRYFVKAQTFAEAERLGRKLGEAVATSVRDLSADAFSMDCELAGALATVELPRRKLPTIAEAEALLAACRADYQRLKSEGADRPRARTAEVAVFGAEGVLALARAQQNGDVDRLLETYRPIQVQVVRVGNACVAGLPGEIFTEFGLTLKQHAPCKAFVVAYANGQLQSYVVTPEAAAAGGYEAAGRLFEPQAGSIMVGAALDLMRKLLP